MNESGNASRQALQNWSCAHAVCRQNLGVQGKLLEASYGLHSLSQLGPYSFISTEQVVKTWVLSWPDWSPRFFVYIHLSIHI